MKSKIRSTKTTLIMLLAFTTFVLVGCSKDNFVEDAIKDIPGSKTNQQITYTQTNRAAFNISGEGTIIRVPSVECPTMKQLKSTGVSKIQGMGKVETVITHCTDYEKIHTIRGMHIFPNGDQLHFHSIEYGIEANMHWFMIVFDGGTGRFDGATGSVKQYESIEMQTNTQGTYITFGSGGTINIPR